MTKHTKYANYAKTLLNVALNNFFSYLIFTFKLLK